MTRDRFEKDYTEAFDSTLLYASKGLRKIAANALVREKFSRDTEIRRLLRPAASRYVVGSNIEEASASFSVLNAKGYLVGAEFVGEEIEDEAQVARVVEENIRFLKAARCQDFANGLQLGFDLSSVGMLISSDLAIENAAKIAQVAEEQDATIMISMERASHTDQILEVFRVLAPRHENVGITIQAHLKRTVSDLPPLISTGRKLRLVKGVYDEQSMVAFPRGRVLDNQYIEIVKTLASANACFSIATHDTGLVQRLRNADLLSSALEVEALHGCNPELQKQLNHEGFRCRITGVYGEEWLLHFLHRLAEHTPNVLTALADFYDPDRIVFGEGY